MINSASLFPDCSTLTNFKAWAQFLSNALASGGWVLQSDTGQVNWGTIGSVPASGSPVYEIWKSSDALTSACPITLKMEYGQNGSAGPEIHYTFGTNGTDGAGNLQTPKAVRNLIGFYTSEDSASVQYPCYVSADSNPSRFSFVMFNDGLTGFPHSYYCSALAISRSVDHTGAATSDYVHGVSLPGGSATNTACWQQCVHNATDGGVDPLIFGVPLCVTFGSTDTTVSRGNALLSPVFPHIGQLGNPTGDLFIGSHNDYADASVVTMTVYGASKNFITFNQALAWSGGTSVAQAALVRYE